MATSRPRRALAASLAVTGLLACAPGHAGAAPPAGPSFDCAKAASPLEKAICADPALAAADRKVAASYAKALAQVPPAWRDPLRDTQRSWLAYMAVMCQPGDLYEREGGATIASCRRAEFKTRAETLDRTMKPCCGYDFVALTTYSARLAAGGAPGDPSASVHVQAERLQFANPTTPAQRQWNAAITAFQRRAIEPDTSLESFVIVEAVSPDLIQAVVNLTYVSSVNLAISLHPLPWSLRLGRPLRAADLFTDPKAAEAILVRVALRNLRKDAAEDGEPVIATTADLRDLARNPDHWGLGKEGLTLQSEDGKDQLGRLARPVPWSDLKPYLRKDLPFDPAALRDSS